MMGRQTGDQAGLFYEFRLADRIPRDHLLRRINVVVGPVLDGVRGQLKPYYSQIGRPSIDPELMIRMLIVGYCFGLRLERRLTQEVELHLAYRWFCRLDLDDKVPHHSTFSENRLNRFRKSDVFRHLFESVVAACMAAGLVKGEGFAVDASVMEANASRYHGKAPDEIVWAEPERQTRAVRASARRNTIEIAVNVYLEQRRRMIAGPSSFKRHNPTKAKLAKIKTFNESINCTNQIVLRHVVVKHGREKRALAPVNPFHKG